MSKMTDQKKNTIIKNSVTSLIVCLLLTIVLHHQDIKAQTNQKPAQLSETTSSVYTWIIDATNTWKRLHNYLPKAKSSGITVCVGVLPPSETPAYCSTCSYSEPYRLDYITWAQEIAKLSIRYSNIKSYTIKDFQHDLSLGYLRQSYIDSMTAAAKVINPALVFDASIYNSGSGDPSLAAQNNFSALLFNVNTNPNLPLSISPTINAYWNADWSIQSIKDRTYIVANPHYDAVNPSPSVTRVQINKNDSYSGLANGKPRAEFQRRNFFFTYGHTFRCTFKNYFPADHQFDVSGPKNQNILMQLKQTDVFGPGAPPRCFGHNGTQYYVEDYVGIPGGKSIFQRVLFGDAKADAGKWVKWTCEFKADSLSGAGHGFKLFKNDSLVYSDNDRIWGYTKNTDFYFKVGAYKPDWLNYTSLQQSITAYIDDIQITDLTTNVTVPMTDFASTGDNLTHYIQLNWQNPTASNFASTCIYRSSSNDPSTAVLIATVDKSVTSYRDNITTAGTKYYWLRAKSTSGSLSSFSPVAADLVSVYGH